MWLLKVTEGVLQVLENVQSSSVIEEVLEVLLEVSGHESHFSGPQEDVLQVLHTQQVLLIMEDIRDLENILLIMRDEGFLVPVNREDVLRF